MFAAAFLFAVAGSPSAQDAAPPERVEAVLTELKLRSESQGAFRARYELDGFPDGNGTLVFDYVPEDRLHMSLELVDPKRAMEMWIDSSRITFLHAEEGTVGWGTADFQSPDLERPEWFTALDEWFPPQSADLECHPVVTVLWSLNAQTNKTDFTFTAGMFPGPKDCLFGWLRALEQDPSLLTLTADAVLQEHPRFRARVSRKTGFLEELAIVSEAGKVATLRLVSLDASGELKAVELLPPTRPAGAQDESVQVAQMCLGMQLGEAPRQTILERVDRQLTVGTIEWNTQAKDGLKAVLRALHEPALQALADRYNPKMQSNVQGFFEELRQRVARGETRTAVQPEVDAWRQALVQELDTGSQGVLAKLAPPPEPSGESALWVDLLTLETAVLTEVFDLHLRQPLLGFFDAEAAKFQGA